MPNFKKTQKIQTIETTNHAQKIKQPKYKGREKEWNPLRQMPRFVVSIVRNGYHIRRLVKWKMAYKKKTSQMTSDAAKEIGDMIVN